MSIADCGRCLGGTEPSIEVDYPTAFVQAVVEQQKARPRKFTYVHCSGVLAERDQTKPLWFLQEGRRAKVHPFGGLQGSTNEDREQLRLSYSTWQKTLREMVYGKLM